MVLKKTQIIPIVILYLFALYLWTLPFQQNRLPYGEVDAVSHFAVGDYTAFSDKPLTALPHYIDQRYGEDNQYKPHTLWYPPPYHVNFAIAQILGGERILSIFLLNAIECTLIILGVFFLINALFGFWPGFLSSLLLIFSTRDINIYLWGQWPERMAFAYLPVILYCLYAYFQNKKPVYLYIMGILLAINLYIHPMVFFHSVLALAIFYTFILIKTKKWNMKLKHLLIFVVIFLILILLFPYQTGNVLIKSGGQATADKGDLSRLFFWYKKPSQDVGLPETHFGYANAHHGYWTLPLLLIGLVFLTLRRKNRDLLLVAWLVSLYIMLHLDILGMGRPFRSLSGTAHIFYPVAVIGLFYIASFFKKPLRDYVKYSLIAVFIILVFAINFRETYPQLKNAYPGVARITPAQYEVSEWLLENTKPEDDINQVGTLTQAKSRWMWMLGHRPISFGAKFESPQWILLDYSDALTVGNQQMIDSMQNLENSFNATPAYDKNNIRVYKVG